MSESHGQVKPVFPLVLVPWAGTTIVLLLGGGLHVEKVISTGMHTRDRLPLAATWGLLAVLVVLWILHLRRPRWTSRVPLPVNALLVSLAFGLFLLSLLWFEWITEGPLR